MCVVYTYIAFVCVRIYLVCTQKKLILSVLQPFTSQLLFRLPCAQNNSCIGHTRDTFQAHSAPCRSQTSDTNKS